jgi:hypothetical protein
MSHAKHALQRLLMPPDTWGRHTIVSNLLGNPESLLDVGGVAGELALFMPKTRIVTANVSGEKADVIFDGDRLPFPDDSFEAAVSLDVLEHIPREHRETHLRELIRVSRGTIVICCPLGSNEHVEAEQELADWYRSLAGEPHRFLEEHLETGLPTEVEIGGLADGLRVPIEMRFHGDFREANEGFRRSVLARRRPSLRTIARYLQARFSRSGLDELRATSETWTNRVFLVAGEPGNEPLSRLPQSSGLA